MEMITFSICAATLKYASFLGFIVIIGIVTLFIFRKDLENLLPKPTKKKKKED